MKDFFYEMIVKSANASELFKNFAFELGVTCVEERGERFIIRDEEDPQNLKFAFEEFKKALARSLNLDADLQIEISKKPNVDWIEQYKKGVAPVAVGKFYVRPSWCERSQDCALIDLLIDPALAFGSGHHESTNMCLALLSELARDGMSALDVGCGSGILSIAMKKLGAKVSACDTDEQAVAATQQNAEKNGVQIDQIWLGSVSSLNERGSSAAAQPQFDLVVANIIADVILILSVDLKKALKPGGKLVLSGILEKYKDRIERAFSDLDFVQMKKQNEWLSFVYERKI
ncbi:50S ribosomal protein L11 methyltransferase [Campylobacter gracilis]|uniref:Ribosomal protein L11 methyltransferase n=1 Tax=Campylobacter gracilis RM3268 TaxID=553220 RepID=C8PLJ5_9BACT|nr:50S ribosomal protein L11 methyltransferase [Campylobacter gracilis]AKT92917.1 50S ribosomal protein L11 methyltransferase [Campylobacter gracilis]EEV16307.1 ribosomal protein L11 methyltransferase [Campylobacter gracilis RM3268]UEB44914.1 50S ribosomal protein L11 methyltransferase [Campylobacter gracilis]SUW78757.1 ribosomal protein L11 methyltransferase [Campylobacter gracilis]